MTGTMGTTEAAEMMLVAGQHPGDAWLCPIPRALTIRSTLIKIGCCDVPSPCSASCLFPWLTKAGCWWVEKRDSPDMTKSQLKLAATKRRVH